MAIASTRREAKGWLLSKSRRVRGHLLLAILAGFSGGLLIIAQAGLFAHIVMQVVIEDVSLSALTSAVLLLGLVIVLRAAMQWLQERTSLEAGIRVRRQVRAELLDHIAHLGPVRLSHRHSAGLAGQLLEHSEALHGYCARFLPQLTLAIMVPLAILITVWQLDWLASLFLLAAAPLIPLFMILIGMGAERLNLQQFETLSRLAGSFLDRIRGLTTLQLFGHAERSIDEVAAAADAYRRRSMRTLKVAFLSSAVLEFFAAVAIATVAIYIGFGLLGYITFGPARELTLFSGLFILLLAPEFFQPLRNLSLHYHDRAAALAAADILFEILQQPAAQATTLDESRPSVDTLSLSNITLSYPGRGRVLGPLDLSIAPGRLVAVGGATGAGKSSLLHVIAGFVSPDSGQVARPHDSTFAWLDQRPFILHGSVADNLRLANRQANDQDLLDALVQVDLTRWLQQQPHGLDSLIGERALGLSGGQAQRLALARVFLSPATLVLLDEPSAHLDPHSETIVLRSLEQLTAQGRSVIIATHHPAVFARAHRVLHLHDGQLSEQDPAHA